MDNWDQGGPEEQVKFIFTGMPLGECTRILGVDYTGYKRAAASIYSHQSLLKAVLASRPGSRWRQEDGKCLALLNFLIGKHFLIKFCRKISSHNCGVTSASTAIRKLQFMTLESSKWIRLVSWRSPVVKCHLSDLVQHLLLCWNLAHLPSASTGAGSSVWFPFPPCCPLFLGLLTATFCVRKSPPWLSLSPWVPKSSRIDFYCGIVRNVLDVCSPSLSVSDICQAECWAHWTVLV